MPLVSGLEFELVWETLFFALELLLKIHLAKDLFVQSVSLLLTDRYWINLSILDGGYTEWTNYSPCTAICIGDVGERVRRRFCTNPSPQLGGLDCQGNYSLNT